MIFPTNAQAQSGGSGHNYSTDEQVVGTWIDGKPIYEKTITYNGNIDGALSHETALLSLTTENIINAQGFCRLWDTDYDTDYGFLSLTFSRVDVEQSLSLWWDNVNSNATPTLRLMSKMSFSGARINGVVCTIQYTKTTD